MNAWTTPLLQIIHVSDLHVRNGDRTFFAKMLMAVTRPAPILHRRVRSGFCCHDPESIDLFAGLIKRFTTEDYPWDRPTWLLATGDLTSFGDRASLDSAFTALDTFHNAGCDEMLTLHGNHDAWPEEFPGLRRDATIAQHRHWMRNRYFDSTWPEDPLRLDNSRIPNSRIDIQLYGLNTVVHDRFPNSFAQGKIEDDRYWEKHPYTPEPGRQMTELANRAQANVNGKSCFRIVATHHPFVFPSFARWDTVDNAVDLARQLNANPETPFHLILSGHAHDTFPRHGDLPSSPDAADHRPLGDEQMQLVTGALMPRVPPVPDSDEWPQQAQILRFWTDDAGESLGLQRILVGRRGGDDEYQVLETTGAGGEGITDERIQFAL